MFRTSLVNKCVTLLISHKLESRENAKVEMCSERGKFESRIIPRSLSDERGVNSCPRKGTVTCCSLETSWRATSFPGFSPTRPTEQERERETRSVGRAGENPGNEVGWRVPNNTSFVFWGFINNRFLRNTFLPQVRDPGNSDANMSGYPEQNLIDHPRTIQY